MSHIWMRHVSHMNESCVIAYIWMTHSLNFCLEYVKIYICIYVSLSLSVPISVSLFFSISVSVLVFVSVSVSVSPFLFPCLSQSSSLCQNTRVSIHYACIRTYTHTIRTQFCTMNRKNFWFKLIHARTHGLHWMWHVRYMNRWYHTCE